jgi:hypothetical protein
MNWGGRIVGSAFRGIKQWILQLELFGLAGQGYAITYGQADTVLGRAVPFPRTAGRVGWTS